MSDPEKTGETPEAQEPTPQASDAPNDTPANATPPADVPTNDPAADSSVDVTRPALAAIPPQPSVAAQPPASAPAAAQPPVTRPASTQAPTRRSVRTIHYNLSYIVRNESAGPRGAVVLLHDLPGGAFTWQDALPAFDATGRAVYAFDLLGYGQSDHPWPSDTSVWGHADNLSYAFQALNLSEIVLVGIGLGGGVAQVLATRLYREQVAKLVLIGSYGYDYAFAPNWPLPDMAKRQDPEAPKHTATDQLISDLRNTLPQGAADSRYLAGSALDAYTNEWNSHVGAELLFQHIRLMLPLYMNSVSSYLRTLDIPTLLIWGEKDTVTPLSLGQRMAREMPNARLVTLPGAGHLVLDEAAAALARQISDFAGSPAPESFVVTSGRHS